MEPFRRRSYLTPSPRVLAWITKVHTALYRATGGLVGARLPQIDELRRDGRFRTFSVLLLTTKGRRSGIARTAVLPFFVYGGRTFLVASFAGRHEHPAWYVNLVADPEVKVQIGRREKRCRAVTLLGAERERFWKMLVEDWPRYVAYQRATPREIPLVEPVDV